MFEIIVGEGTCGIAAGSKEVIKSFAENAPGARISTVGCKGMCHEEVMAEIRDPSTGKFFMYGQLSKKNISRVLDFHYGRGDMPEDLLLFSSENPDHEKGNYLKRQTRIALRNVGELNPESLEQYKSRDGYQALEKILQEQITPEQIIEEVKLSGLRGRGGAGFPTHQKWTFARNVETKGKYLICNGDEGDPGAFMDRSLLEGDPHCVVEGMLIAAYAIGADTGYAYIRAEYPLAVKNFGIAIEEATKAGLLGKNILGSDFSFKLIIKQGAGAFVCGEETALMASVEGERGMPRLKPPFPAISGLYKKPTIINNVETLANIPWIIKNGGSAFAGYGTEKSRGTKVFALAGAIARGGLVEIPMGMTIRQVLYDIGGGNSNDKPLKAVQLGGPSGGCVPERLFDTPIEYESINATGAIMGSGGMIAMDNSTCMVDIACYFLEFTQAESCGKCTFCRIGTLRMMELLRKICDGNGTISDLQTLEELALKIKNATLCGLGQTAPNPVLTTLKYFREEYLEHIEKQRCPAGVCKKLITHKISQENCTACSVCKKRCPVGSISGEVKVKGSFTINPEICTNCGICVEVCKFEAIYVE
ncbi:NADH-ubiquinone oxidoreductase-F iron-sulfur binding region domain-containing protein [Candidatus Riflebacteria bacterium]